MVVRYYRLRVGVGEGMVLLDRPEITTHFLPTGFLAGGSCYRPQWTWNPGIRRHESLTKLYLVMRPGPAGAAAREA